MATAVIVLDLELSQINILQTAGIDRGRGVASRAHPFTKGMNPTVIAKVMLDFVGVEGVRGEVLLRREQAQLLTRH